MKVAAGMPPKKSVYFCVANSGRNPKHPNYVILKCLIIKLSHSKAMGRNMPVTMYLKIHWVFHQP